MQSRYSVEQDQHVDVRGTLERVPSAEGDEDLPALADAMRRRGGGAPRVTIAAELRSAADPDLAYWWLLAVQPASLFVSAVAAVLAGCLAGPLAAGLLLAMVGCTLSMLGRYGFARASLDRLLEQRSGKERATNRESRLARLDSPRRPDLQQLTALVHQIERAWPCESRALELEDLLDLFAARAVVHEGYRRALCVAPPRLLSMLSPGTASPLRSELFRRRTELRDEYERRAAALDEELDEIAEFVRLVALRAARPVEEDPQQEDGELVRRLRQFDAREAALKQLGTLRSIH